MQNINEQQDPILLLPAPKPLEQPMQNRDNSYLETIENTEITFGNNIRHPEQISIVKLKGLLDVISKGNFAEEVEKVRNTEDPELQKTLKCALPWVSMAKFRTRRALAEISSVNGLILDFDHVSDIDRMKQSITSIPFVWSAFQSVRDGVKFVVPFAKPLTDIKRFKAIFDYISFLCREELGFVPDASASDASRAHFVSYDPEPVFNHRYLPFDWEKLAPVIDGFAHQEIVAQTPVFDAREFGELDERVLLSAVQYLAGRKFSYLDFIRCGIALHSALGEKGLPYWEFFGTNPNYQDDQKYLLEKWKSFASCDLSIGTLFFIAKNEGWNSVASDRTVAYDSDRVCCDLFPKGHAFETGTKPGNKTQPAAEIKNLRASECTDTTALECYATKPECYATKPECYATPKYRTFMKNDELVDLFGKQGNIPLDTRILPPILQEYLAQCDTITDACSGAKLSAVLPVMAANIGNRVYMMNNSSRLYCNIWSMIIGPSSISRKTTVIRLAKNLIDPYEESLSELEIEEYLKSTLLMTDVTMAKFLQMLSLNPNRLFMQSEVSAWLKTMNRNWNSGMKQALTDLYDGVDKDIVNMDRCERIRKPAFSIVAGTTEGWFMDELKSNSDQQSGFLQRFIYCFIREVDLQNIDLNYREASDSGMALRAYDKMLSTFRNIPGSFKLSMDANATEFRNQAYKEQFNSVIISASDALVSYFTRIYDGYFFKFCTLFTLLNHWEGLAQAIEQFRVNEFFRMIQVDENTAKAAFDLCSYYYKNTLPFIETIKENQKLANEKRIVRILCQADKGRMDHSTIMVRTRFNKREMREAMDCLIERDAVVVDCEVGYHNKTRKVYVLNNEILKSWN